MRFLPGLLILLIPTFALAQVTGEVVSIGFDNHIRPDCWTPMLVQLKSTTPQAGKYQIQISQEDLDRDQVIFPQMVSLGGTVEGQSQTTGEFWVYFRPKPTGDGLPDTLADLNAVLKVYVCTESGKQISVIHNTATVVNIDPKRSQGDTSRSRKEILVVMDRGSLDTWSNPFQSGTGPLRGVLEEADVVSVRPIDLPTNVIGYDAVDEIVWLDANANDLAGGTQTPKLEALEQWVNQGGHLIVCQPAEPMKVKAFADLLPVTSKIQGDWDLDMQQCKDGDKSQIGQGPFEILRRLSGKDKDSTDDASERQWGPIKTPITVARAVPTRDAKVIDWMTWNGKESTYHTPWLARRTVGLGAVTWVAQDLGSPVLPRGQPSSWQNIWNHVFDWNNPRDLRKLANENDWDNYRPAGAIDLGAPLIKGMDLTNKAAWMVSLACLFFVGYWIVAGPGIYFFLLSKKRAHQSWFYFGLSALVATGLTVLLVKIVVRGPPELRHVSFVRYAAGEHAIVDSRFGLYIPQDGNQTIDVKDFSSGSVSYIAPLAINPQFVSSDDAFPASLVYEDPVRDANDSSPLSVNIPYRSTSKKFDVHWVGEIKNKVEIKFGTKLTLEPSHGYVDGTLVNHSGTDLADVYLAFKTPSPGLKDSESIPEADWVIYVPTWPKDGELTFKDLLINDNMIKRKKHAIVGDKPSFGTLDANSGDWYEFWSQTLQEHVVDANSHNANLAMLMLFDRLPPWQTHSQSDKPRFELYRRNARFMNLSAAESAGSLVMVAVAMPNNSSEANKSPLPVTLDVSGKQVTGEGTTMVQCVFPIDRSVGYGTPATRPTVMPPPTTAPAK